MKHLARSLWRALLAAAFLPTGCLFLPGPARLERIIAQRPSRPFATTVFGAAPSGSGRQLSELRAAMVQWAGTGSGGRARFEGVLAPEPRDLYDRVIAAIDGGAGEITLVAHKYDSNGLDDLTLVDYFDERGERIGFDYVLYHHPPPPPGGPAAIGYDAMAWWEYPQLILDAPVYLALGLKELALEIAKSPLSAIEAGWIGGSIVGGWNPLSPVCFEDAGAAFVEDWRDGWTALSWRFRARARHTPLDLARDVLAAAPILGPIFDVKAPPPALEAPPARLIALSRGIHGRGDAEQHVFAFERAVGEYRPETPVVTLPYRQGGLADVAWSLLNLSNGSSYDAASRLVFDQGVRAGEAVELVGFSGGVQRHLAATRLLGKAGIAVNDAVGIAGPWAGCAAARRSLVLLGGDAILDPVVLTARAIDAFYFPFPDNIEIVVVPGAGGHTTPYFPHGETRSPSLGYGEALASALRAALSGAASYDREASR